MPTVSLPRQNKRASGGWHNFERNMKNVLMIVTRENQLLQITGFLTPQQNERLEEICVNGEHVAVDFTCPSLEVSFKTETGALVHMHT